MLYDVAALVKEEMTVELIDVLIDAFSFGSPSLARSDQQGRSELYVTYEARDFEHALHVLLDTLGDLCELDSVTIDAVNGDGHRPPPAPPVP